MSMAIPALPLYFAGLGSSASVVGFALALRGIGTAAANLPAARLVRRFGARSTLLIGAAVAAVGTALLALTSNVTIALALFAVRGAGTSILVVALLTRVRLSVDRVHRGRALSLAGGALRVGGLVAPLLGGVMADALGPRAVFVAMAAVGVVGVLPVLLSRDSGSTAPDDEIGAHVRLLPLIRSNLGTIALIGAATMALTVMRTVRGVLLPLHGDSLGLSATRIGLALSIGQLVEVPLALPAGLVMDRAGRRWSLVIATAGFVLGYLVLPSTAGVLGLALVSLVVSIGNGFGSGINMTLATDMAPRRAAGTFIAWWRLYTDIGGVVGPFAVGAVVASLSIGAAAAAAAAVGIGGILVVLFVVKEPRDLHAESGPAATDRPPAAAPTIDLSTGATTDGTIPQPEAGCGKE